MATGNIRGSNEMEATTNALFGYFDSPGQETPAHDPGINAPCLVCFRPLDYPNTPIVTISFSAYFDNAERSYFYRCHKACYNSLSDQEKGDIEAGVMGNGFGSQQDLGRLERAGYTTGIGNGD